MSTELISYADARAYLYGLKHRGANYGIDRMRLMVERLNHPELSYPVIHVAGTNGKGSTCALLESIYRAAGYRTGMFTSPHLVQQGERVQVNREILDRAGILAYTRKLRPIAEAIESEVPDHHPSFFEFMTAMALLRFAEAKVDIGIIETGLGGRLDATNVVQPELSIITSISFDHTEILGDTISKIALEKAGIIKPGKPVITGWLPVEAERVIEAVCSERGCVWMPVKQRFGVNLDAYPQTGLPCSYQRINAAMAALAVDVLQEKFPVRAQAVEQGLADARWAGRWDRRQLRRGSIILDASHNPEGVEQLDRQLAELVEETGRRPKVMLAALGELRAAALIPTVCKHASAVYLLMPRVPRACSHSQLRRFIPEDYSGKIVEATVADCISEPGTCNLIEGDDEVIVATGSIYLIGELLDALENGVLVNDGVLQD